MPRWLQWTFGLGIASLLVAGPWYYASYRQSHVRNFRVVKQGILYRSGQLSLPGLRRVIHDYGIKTVVSLRDAARLGESAPDLEEEIYCLKEDINFRRISPRTWWSPDGSVPAEAGVRQFREVMADPTNYPVLVHCYAGVHRTGVFCAIYRMEHDRWTNDRALAEMKACGYDSLTDDWDLLDYLEKYQPTWKGPGAGSPSKTINAQPVRRGKTGKSAKFWE